MDKRRGNLVIAGIFTAVAIGMVGLSFAAIPLYRAFCQATGYGGTPKIGVAAAPGGDGKTIRVRFNADVNPGLAWSFAPDQLELGLRHRPRERTGRRAAPCYIGRAMTASSLARLTFAFTPPGG